MVTTTESKRRSIGHEQAADALRLAIARTGRRLRQEAGYDLTPSRLSVLNTVARQGAITPSKLADVEGISRPTTTRLIAKLRAQGLVERVTQEDGRSYQITLSEDGSALKELRRERKSAYLARLLSNASADEIELLDRAARLLLRLVEEEGE